MILKNQANFREIGGFTTKSGKRIKEKSIFRSGFLGKLDASDIEILKELNVGKVIDLRTSQEIELIGKGDYPSFLSYEHIPLNTGNISKLLLPIFEKGEFQLIAPNLLDHIYIDLVTKFTSEFAAIFRSILNAKYGVIYHCSHGKDRTGIISALLLEFLGVDRKVIYSDYLKSNELLKQQNEFQLQMIKANFTQQFNRDVTEEEFAPVKSLFYCREEILKAVFSYLDDTYGSVRNYFSSALGLSEEELALFKSRYIQ